MKSRVRLFIVILITFMCNIVFAHDVYSPYVPQNNEVIFNQSMFKIDVIDPKVSTNWKGLNYPGLRGNNQLVIYTPAFGYRTNTNEYGTEAIVTGDTVTSLSGADSLIPANGFVISGHGLAKKWINENIMVGTKISIDLNKKVITSYITSDTFLYTARERIREVQEMMLYSENGYYELFPALPKKWNKVSFKTLRGWGGVLVSAKIENSSLKEAKFQAENDVEFILRTPVDGLEITGGKTEKTEHGLKVMKKLQILFTTL